MGSPSYGCDVSHWQTANWRDAPLNIRFAYVKATEGSTYTDPNYVTNRDGLRATGRYCGAYHFLDSSDPIVQARHFASIIGKPGRGFLPPVVDVEKSDLWQGSVWLANHVTRFMDEVLALTGRRVGIYVSDSVPADRFGARNWKKIAAKAAVVWIAKYSNAKPSTSCSIWQYDEFGHLSGISGDAVDLDVFFGTPKQLDALALVYPAKVVKKPVKPKTVFKKTGNAIKDLQRMLNTHGAHLLVDGVYGKQTVAAVKAYQHKVGLVVDGVYGPATRKSLGL